MSFSDAEERQTPALAIVLVNYNGFEDTLKCLDSIQQSLPPHPLTIVVENGSSTDQSTAIQVAHPWVHVIRREENGGWAGGNNTGIRYALDRGADWVVLLNNDTVVSPNLIVRLTAATFHKEYGVIGPIINSMSSPTEVMTDGCNFNTSEQAGFFHRKSIPVISSNSPTINNVDIVNGCCMMIGSHVFQRIGLIDERFFLIHEESDFCLRAWEAGFRCGVIGESLVWHKGSSSFKRAGNGFQRYYDTRNLYLLLRKHRATSRGGRGRLASWIEYAKYVYYRYSIEREQNEDQAAEAVVRGLCDALAGRFGPLMPARRLTMPVLRIVLEFVRRTRLRPARG